MQETGLRPDDPALNDKVETQIYAVTNGMQNLVHGFDFAKVLAAYWNGYKLGDDDRRERRCAGSAGKSRRRRRPARTLASESLSMTTIGTIT